jgi:methylmalonyl-CoA mutase N-terminal domain/subunit
MYRDRLWTFRQYAGFSSAAETNQRYRYLLDQGQTGLSVAFDLPTQIGYDSDDPIALGEVGKVGVPISCLDDLDELLDGIPLDTVSVSMTINATAPILLAFHVALAKRRGVDLATLRGTLQNDILKEFITRRTYRFPVRPSLRLVTDVFRFAAEHLPRWNPISVSGYHMREAGANAVQELGLTIANAIAYFEEARRAGIDLAYLGRRVSFFWNAHNHLFEEVAKFRAARRLWASVIRDRFGIHDASCARMRFHTQTAGSTLTSQEPENNVVRVTVQALAAVLGGTQSLHTNGMDEAIGLPTRKSARTALRTQQILAHESGVADVVDPLGGCPLIENLTEEIESRARDLLAEIDAMGGAVAAVEKSFQQSIIEEEAYRHQRHVESGETTVVAVNRFGEPDSDPAPQAQKVDPAVEGERITALRERKSSRDSSAVDVLTAKLRERAASDANVVDTLVECAEGGVTLGEMSAALADVFGEHRE